MTQLVANAIPQTISVMRRRRTWPTWARIFVSGLALWGASVGVTFATSNTKLIPTIVLIGSFLIPVTFVAFALSRADEVVTAPRIFTAFVYGGVLGVLGASSLEAVLLRQPSGLAYFGVGLVEEAVKLAALALIAWRLPRYTMRDGIVLGAAVGFGFAAFESAGYAFNALFTSSGLSLMNMVETEMLRGILAPVGHGLWTAILGGALFAAAARRRRRRLGPGLLLSGALLGWYVVVSLLHGLWDASQGIAVWLTERVTGHQVWWLLGHRSPAGPQAQVHIYTAVSWVLLILIGLVGVLILRRRWHAATAVASSDPYQRLTVPA